MSSIKNDVIAYAREIGLDLVGVTSPEPFDRFLSEIKARAEHYQERYAYRLETWKKMAAPRELMPDARAVVVMGFYYLADESESSEPHGLVGRIVSYGHLGILKRARLVRKFLEQRGFKAVMGAHRKEAAVRAGLGMVGKNNLVLNPEFGAWVAYQSIVTNAPMEPDAPFTRDLCGKCEICLKACPTGALYEAHRVDPRRCIAYLLTSRDVAKEYWPKMGTSMLACDRCLDACPRNKGLNPKKDIEQLLPENMGTQPPLKRMLGFTEDSFQKELIGHIQNKISDHGWLNRITRNKMLRKVVRFFMKTVLKGKEVLPETFVHASGNLMVYKKNALIAAGNLGDGAMLEDVKRFIDDPYLGVYARWAEEKLSQ